MVQVQAVDGLMVKAKNCGCCHPGAAPMPCCPQPASAPTTFSAAPTACVASLPARRRAQPSRGAVEKFYVSFIEPAAVRPVLRTSAAAASAARVPLFKAHCSFLI